MVTFPASRMILSRLAWFGIAIAAMSDINGGIWTVMLHGVLTAVFICLMPLILICVLGFGLAILSGSR